MAEDFLEKLYKEADAYTRIYNLVAKYRNGNHDSNFVQDINTFIPVLEKLGKELVQIGDNRGQKLWNGLIELTKTKSLLRCLDILEISVLPEVLDYIKSQPRIDVDDEEGIILRSSELGFIYQIKTESMSQCESAYNPMQEAYHIVKDFYDSKEYEYVLLGGGLGYIPYQMYLQSDGDIHLTIFYHDQKSYEYAKLYGVLEWIPEEYMNVVVTDDILEFLCAVRDSKSKYYIYKPDMSKYPAKEIEALNKTIITQNTIFTTSKYVTQNYYRNIRRVGKFINEYPKNNFSDKFLIVAGGPSVDENTQFIKSCQKIGVKIISVGTVFKKLLKLGVIPDIVTACDPFVTCSKQFEGIEDGLSTVLFLGVETDYRVAKLYKGEKYIVPTEVISQEINADIRKHTNIVLPGCITVTSLSYCIANYLGAKEIYLVGADYGYPGGFSHAEGTNDRQVVTNNSNYKVISTDGSMIEANAQMILYREEMEQLIANNKHISTYNMSKHGAMIKGTLIYNDEE